MSIPPSGIHVLFLAVATAIAGMYAMNAPTPIEFAGMSLATLMLALLTLLAKYHIMTGPSALSWVTGGAGLVGITLGLIGVARNAPNHFPRR